MEPDELNPEGEVNCVLGKKILKKSDLENSNCTRQEKSTHKFSRNQSKSEHDEQSITCRLQKLRNTGTSINELEEKLEALETSSGTKVEHLTTHQPGVSDKYFSLRETELMDAANFVQTMSSTSKSRLLGTSHNSDEQTLLQHELCDSSDNQQQPGYRGYTEYVDIEGTTSFKMEETENFNSYPDNSSTSMQENTGLQEIPKLPSPPISLPSSSSSSNCDGSDNIDSLKVLNESGSSPKQLVDTAAQLSFKYEPTIGAPGDLTREKAEKKKVSKTASFPASGSSAHSRSSSYIYSSASATSLPSTLHLFDDNYTHIVWPLQDNLSVEKMPDDKEEYTEGKHWLLLVELGRGAYGSCHLAIEPHSAEKVFCVKKCQYSQDEVLPLYLAAKENIYEIVTFLGATINRKEACIFMELLGSSIEDIVQSEIGLKSVKPLAVAYLQDVLRALSFIHRKGIVHNDVKGANVLFVDDSQLRVKLIDFGNATSSKVCRYLTKGAIFLPRKLEISSVGQLQAEMIGRLGLLAFSLQSRYLAHGLSSHRDAYRKEISLIFHDLQSFTLMMASAQAVETSVNTNNSPSQDYTTNPDDHSNHNN